MGGSDCAGVSDELLWTLLSTDPFDHCVDFTPDPCQSVVSEPWKDCSRFSLTDHRLRADGLDRRDHNRRAKEKQTENLRTRPGGPGGSSKGCQCADHRSVGNGPEGFKV